MGAKGARMSQSRTELSRVWQGWQSRTEWRALALRLRKHPWLQHAARVRHPRAIYAYGQNPFRCYVCDARMDRPRHHNDPHWRAIAEHLMGHMPPIQALSVESLVAQTNCPVRATCEASSWVASDWLQETGHPYAPAVLGALVAGRCFVEDIASPQVTLALPQMTLALPFSAAEDRTD